MLNIYCSYCTQNCIFFTFWRLKTLVLWHNIVWNLLLFLYLFCPKNSTVDSRKTSITQQWFVTESCPATRRIFNAQSITISCTIYMVSFQWTIFRLKCLFLIQFFDWDDHCLELPPWKISYFCLTFILLFPILVRQVVISYFPFRVYANNWEKLTEI